MVFLEYFVKRVEFGFVFLWGLGVWFVGMISLRVFWVILLVWKGFLLELGWGFLMLVGVEWYVLFLFWLIEVCCWIFFKENLVWKLFLFLFCIFVFVFWILLEYISRDIIWLLCLYVIGILLVIIEVIEGLLGFKLLLLILEIVKFDIDFVVLVICDEVLRWWLVVGEKFFLFVLYSVWIFDDILLWDK